MAIQLSSSLINNPAQQQVNPLVYRDISPYHSKPAKGPMLDLVYSLRYQSYSAENYIKPNASGMFMDEFDSYPQSQSFLTYYHDKLIGSIRACTKSPSSEWRIPAMDIFEHEIAENIGMDKTIVEANKFVVHPDFQRRGGVKARLSIYRNIVDFALSRGAHCIVAAVRPAHVNFYHMYEPISDAKVYPQLSFQTVLMVCHDLESLRDFIWSRTGE